MLSHTFDYFNIDMVRQLYKTFVRPHLEYAVAVWSPYLLGDIRLMERVQHRMTRVLPNLRELCYEDRLKILKLTTLKLRRERGDVIQMYKLINNIDHISFLDKTYMAYEAEYMERRGNQKKLEIELVTSCNSRYNFYANRVARLWRNLSPAAVNASSMNEFKERIEGDYGIV